MSITTENPYLSGNFGPVSEELTTLDLPVTGSLPDHLEGRYVRNGPNPVAEVDPAAHHWFLGSGMVHGIRLRNGRAEWYRNRFVRSADVARALGEPPRPGPVHAGFDFSPNTNVIQQDGRTFTIVESGPRPYQLTEELDTIGSCDFDGTLAGGYTAHPKRDPETDELHAVSYYWGWGNRVQYTVMGIDARIRRAVDIEVAGSPMMHDFSLTEGHVVLYDLPVTFDTGAVSGLAPKSLRPAVRRVMEMFVGKRSTPGPVARLFMGRLLAESTPMFPYRWDPNYPARVGVLRRNGTAADVRWFEVEPCYVFHPLNAYDDGDRIVLDVVRHPKMFDTHRLGPDEGPPTLDRWTVDLVAGKVLEERRDDRGQEFPRVDERLVGRRHRYGYTVAFDQLLGHSLIKHDVLTGQSTTRSFGDGHDAGEFVFVPDDVDAAEDRGTLLGYVYNPETNRSDLMLLDAETLETIGAVHLPARVPAGFHGNWLPAVRGTNA